MKLQIVRGFAKNQREEDALRDYGVTTIYRADRGEVLGKFRMRRGELLGVVNLRAFGPARRDMVAAISRCISGALRWLILTACVRTTTGRKCSTGR